MKIKSIEEISLAGDIALIYGQMGTGKTLSTLLTAPLPIAYLDPENRPLRPTIDVIKEVHPERLNDIGFVEWENYNAAMDWLNNYETNLKDYGTLFMDSYTALMSMMLLPELQDQDYAGRTTESRSKKAEYKDIIARTKTSQEMYGALGAGVIRITGLLKTIAKSGIVVICSALEDPENLSLKIGYERGPALEGQMFLKAMPGNFNLIGRVVPRYTTEANIEGVSYKKLVYPPTIYFRDPTGKKFLSKFTGRGDKTSGPLDWNNILRSKDD